MKNKTTVAGVFTLFPVLFAMWNDWRKSISDPVVISTLTAGIGLLLVGSRQPSDPPPTPPSDL